MSDFQGREAFVIEQAFDATSTTQLHEVGSIVRAFDTATTAQGVGEFIYLQGVGSTVLGDWVTYRPDDWTTALLAPSAVGPCAIAMVANTLSQFGWYQISGKAVGRCLTQFADDGIVYISAGTVGTIDDDSVLGDLVYNAVGASLTTIGTFVADFEIWRPYTNNRVNPA